MAYTDFRINLTQFYINFSRQEHQIELSWFSINSKDTKVSGYIPLHFSFTLPLIKALKNYVFYLSIVWPSYTTFVTKFTSLFFKIIEYWILDKYFPIFHSLKIFSIFQFYIYKSELKTLELWISRSMFDLLFFLISR